MGHCGCNGWHSDCEKDGKAVSHEEANTTDERIAALEKTVAMLVKSRSRLAARIAYLEELGGR